MPVFHYALPLYLEHELERVQRRDLSIICAGLDYKEVLIVTGMPTIISYNEGICDSTFTCCCLLPTITRIPQGNIGALQFPSGVPLYKSVSATSVMLQCYAQYLHWFNSYLQGKIYGCWNAYKDTMIYEFYCDPGRGCDTDVQFWYRLTPSPVGTGQHTVLLPNDHLQKRFMHKLENGWAPVTFIYYNLCSNFCIKNLSLQG